MPALAHQALLLAASTALLAAGLRSVSPAQPSGLLRWVAAAPLAAAGAVAGALALGLVGLGGSAAALAAVAGACWLATRALTPAPAVSPLREPLDRLLESPAAPRAVAGAAAGLFVVLCAWLLRHPAIGFDGVNYQLSEVLAWLDEGSPGAVVESYYDFPTGAYPLTNEVLLGWGTALADSFVWATLWTPLMVLLMGVAVLAGLRERGVAAEPALLAVAALVTLPISVRAYGQPGSDVAATAWLTCAGALAAAVPRSPGLAAPALVAAGLAAGTKTTALPLALACIVFVLVVLARRGLLRRHAVLLAAAGAAALAVGGIWFLRNLVLHGSPLWPFNSAPWGDPVPPLLEALDHNLIERPRATLEGRTERYGHELGGALVLAPAAVLLGLLSRSREAAAAAGLAALSLLLWAAAPITGMGDVPGLEILPISALRYLLPALAVCCAALALAHRAGGRRAHAVTVAFAVVVAANIGTRPPADYPHVPGAATLAAGALAGLLAAFALTLVVDRLPRLRRAAPAVAVVVVGSLALAPAVAVDGYLERHVEVGATGYGELLRWFYAHGELQAGSDGVSIAMANTRPATLSGERLQNTVELLPRREPCARVAQRRRRGQYLVLNDFEPVTYPGGVFPIPGPVRCLRESAPSARIGTFRVYAPQPAQ